MNLKNDIKDFEIASDCLEHILQTYNTTEDFKLLDHLLINSNKVKYKNTAELLNSMKHIKIPTNLNIDEITLFTLLNYFQKKYVLKKFILHIENSSFQKKIPYIKIDIINKLSNFPHLLGVKGERNSTGQIISKSKPRKFLDGVLYQWILMNNLEDFVLDFEKLETLPWIWQTLVMPTYILPKESIKKENTKFDADLIFVKRVFNSSKYSFHLVGLKNEDGNNFTIVSQFPISKERYHRIESMFDTNKAYYDFYKSNKKAPISSGSARSTYIVEIID